MFNQNLKCGRKTFFEQVAEELRDVGTAIATFFECLVPDRLKSCVSDAIRSAKSCLSLNKPCKVQLGGKGSSCLAIKKTRHFFDYKEGLLRMSGDIDTKGAFSTSFDFTNSKLTIDFTGSIGFNNNIVILAHRAHVQPKISKKLYLTDCIGTKCLPCSSPTKSYKCLPETVFRRAFAIGYMPVLIEVKIQLVAFIDLEIKAMDRFNISTSHKKEGAININSARVELDLARGVSLHISLNKDFERKFLKTILIQSGVDIMAAIRIGPEITFSVNGIPLSVFAGIRFAMEGLIPKLPPNDITSACVDGYFKFGIGVDVGVGADTREITISRFLGTACSGIVTVACYLDKAVNCMAQAIKAGKTKFHSCEKMKTYCSIMEKKVAALLPFQLGKSFYGTDVKIPGSYVDTPPNRFAFCNGSAYTFKAVSATIGSTKLYGGGGGKKLGGGGKKLGGGGKKLGGGGKKKSTKKRHWWNFLFGSSSSLVPQMQVVLTLCLTSSVVSFAFR